VEVGNSMKILGYILLAVGAAFLLVALSQGLPYHEAMALVLTPGASLAPLGKHTRHRRRAYLSDFATRC
jgi:hypothetical protein